MQHSPIIFVAGMPRSGSMWTYNVCRQLITAAGKSPWPDEVPQDETPVIQEALSKPPAPNQVYCIKTHFQVPVGKPQIRIICNYRDVRDAMLSYMRFMKCSFDKALAAARGSMAITDHYLQHPHPDVFPVRYNTMIESPRKMIGALATFLDLSATKQTIVEIEQSLSRDAVRKRLASLEAEPQTADSTVQNLDGSTRVYDQTTGFQSNHISSNQDGEWRNALTQEQIEQLESATDEWLRRYHFISREDSSQHS